MTGPQRAREWAPLPYSHFPWVQSESNTSTRNTHTYTRTYTHTPTHMYTHMHTPTHVHTDTRTHAHTDTHVHTPTHVPTCIHPHTCTRLHTCMHMHTCTHMHTHGHTPTHARLLCVGNGPNFFNLFTKILFAPLSSFLSITSGTFRKSLPLSCPPAGAGQVTGPFTCHPSASARRLRSRQHHATAPSAWARGRLAPRGAPSPGPRALEQNAPGRPGNRLPEGHRPQGCENLGWGLWRTYNSGTFHRLQVLAFKRYDPNGRGNDSTLQAKSHTFRQTKKITIKVQIYSACVIVIIIASRSIYAQQE